MAADSYAISRAALAEFERQGVDLSATFSRATLYGKQGGKNPFIYEHAVPAGIVRAALLAGPRTDDAIASVLQAAGPVAVLLRTEDDRLNAAGFNAKMPEGWQMGDDSLARYAAVGIALDATETLDAANRDRGVTLDRGTPDPDVGLEWDLGPSPDFGPQPDLPRKVDMMIFPALPAGRNQSRNSLRHAKNSDSSRSDAPKPPDVGPVPDLARPDLRAPDRALPRDAPPPDSPVIVDTAVDAFAADGPAARARPATRGPMTRPCACFRAAPTTRIVR